MPQEKEKKVMPVLKYTGINMLKVPSIAKRMMEKKAENIKKAREVNQRETAIKSAEDEAKKPLGKNMVRGEMGGVYTKSEMAKMKNEFSKSLQDQKDYTARYQKMTPAQKSAEGAKFKASYEKLRQENAKLNSKNMNEPTSSKRVVGKFLKTSYLVPKNPSVKSNESKLMRDSRTKSVIGKMESKIVQKKK